MLQQFYFTEKRLLKVQRRPLKKLLEKEVWEETLPLIKINKSFILNNVEILSFLNETKIFSSKSEARRAIENKAIKINDELVRDYKDHLSIKDFVDEKD